MRYNFTNRYNDSSPNSRSTKMNQHLMIAIFFSLFILFVGESQASHQTIGGFSLKHCSPETCWSIKADKAYRGQLDGIYAFGSSVMESSDGPAEPLKNKIVSNSGHYDPLSQRVTLSEIEGQKFKELVVNLKTGKVFYF